MKKVMSVILLLLVCFFYINVKADDEISTDVIATDPEVAGIEKKEEANEGLVKAEAEPTRGEATSDGAKAEEVELDPKVEAELHSDGGHHACIYFIREYDNANIGSACDGSNKTFVQTTLLNDYENAGTKYVFKGWYDADGELITTDKRMKIKAPVATDKCELMYVYAKFDTFEAPKIKFTYTDSISTGSGSWSNTGGSTSAYTHTFRKPDEPNHYQFLYWELDGDKYQDGDKFKFSFSGMQYGEEKEFEAYAYWQADVTVNLYDENKKLISSESSFESVTIDDLEDKDYEDFIGWVDENGNEVTERTFYPNEMGTKPEPVEITLYAKYKLVRRDIEVTKVWSDEDNEDKRPESVTVTLKADEEVIDEVELSEENEWKYIFEKVNIYDEDNEEINYTVEEKEVPEGYEVSYEGDMEEGFTIHNVLGQGDGEPDTHNPQTGDNIVLYLITLIIGVTGLIGGKLALKENN